MQRWLLVIAVAACGDDGATPDGGAGDGPAGDGAVTGCTPAAGWTAAPDVGTGPTQETATVALDGTIYVIGGFDDALQVVDTIQVFDTATCAWSLGPALPRPVHHANAAVHGGRIYVVGAMEGNFIAVGHTWSWAPGDAGWATHASMPAGTQRGAAVTGTIGDAIYVAGGLRNGAVPTVSSYTPATDTWSAPLPSLPAMRDHGCGGVVGGKLYVTGGRNGQITGTTGSVLEYTPGGADWVAKMEMPTARGGTACGVVGDRIIVVGGEGNPAPQSRGVFPQVESYDPAADLWTEHDPMRTPRHGMGAAAWNGSLYVPGGATAQGFGAVATNEILTLTF